MSGEPKDNVSCLRELKSFEPGQDLNLWVCQFCREMVEKKLHQHILQDEESDQLATRIQTRKRVPRYDASNKEKLAE